MANAASYVSTRLFSAAKDGSAYADEPNRFSVPPRLIRLNPRISSESACASLTHRAMSPVRNARGKIIGDSTIAHDIAARRQLEAEPQDSQERLRLAVEGARLGTWHWNLATGELEWSPQSFALFGVPPDTKITFQDFLTAVHPDDRILIEGGVKRSLADHSEFDVEVRVIRADRTQRWIAARGHVFQNGAGENLRMGGIVIDVTERHQTEEVVHKLAALLDLAHDAIIVRDLQSKVAFWNRGAEALYGWSAEQASGRVTHELFQTRFPVALEKIEAALAKNGEWEGELRHTTSQAQEVVVASRWSLQRDENAKPAAILEINRDITLRKQAEGALRESEERFQAMADGIPQLAWMAGPDGSVFWYNRRWYDYTGKTFEQMAGCGWQDVQDPGMLTRVIEGWKGAVTSGRAFEMEFPLRAADGSFKTFLTRVVPLKDSNGDVTRWFGTNTDVSERKLEEERLAGQAEELSRQADELIGSRTAPETRTRMLKLVLDSVGEGLVAADVRGHFLIWNDSAKKLLGRGPADLPPEQWASHYGCYESDGIALVPQDRLPLVRAMKGESVHTELLVRQPGREQGVLLEFTGRPMMDAQGNSCGGVVAFHDTTERRAAEREIRKLNEELEGRVRQLTAELEAANQELEAFTYSVAHDLRAPLRHMSGFSTLLNEEYGPKLEAEAQHYLKRISDGTRKMGQLLDELLSLARVGRQTPKLQVTGLNSIVAEVIAMSKADCEGRKVEWKIAELPFVDCDPTLMKLVFQNLISIALKYSRPRPEAMIEIGQMETKDGENAIFVRDNGVGFSMEYVDKLFGVFQRLHRVEDFEGTGVGLATVRRVIKKHGGRAWAEAELDRGATFYFTLSSAEQKRKPEAAAPLGAPA